MENKVPRCALRVITQGMVKKVIALTECDYHQAYNTLVYHDTIDEAVDFINSTRRIKPTKKQYRKGMIVVINNWYMNSKVIAKISEIYDNKQECCIERIIEFVNFKDNKKILAIVPAIANIKELSSATKEEKKEYRKKHNLYVRAYLKA